ncbi:MAG TPA: hypothetical protein VFT15_16830, partial [Chitinophagaceae bacterium]|nr:hypothetical protein [Chitinophagaceae bacterium]
MKSPIENEEIIDVIYFLFQASLHLFSLCCVALFRVLIANHHNQLPYAPACPNALIETNFVV